MDIIWKILVLSASISVGHEANFSIPDSAMSVLGKVIEKESLTEIKKTFGETTQYHSGDAAESDTRINYFLYKENVYLVFASGEMGGGEILTDVRLKRKVDEKYLRIPNKLRSNDFCGVRIGDTKMKIEDKLKIKVMGDTVRIINDKNLEIKGMPYSESKGLYLIFKNDSLDGATIWKTTIN